MNIFTLKLQYCNAEPILKKFFIAFMFLMKAGIGFASSWNVAVAYLYLAEGMNEFAIQKSCFGWFCVG